MTLDTLAPVFTVGLGPYLPEKPEELAPYISLGPALTAPTSHIPVSVQIHWGLTPNPLDLAITAPTTSGPARSASANPGPDSVLTALSPHGPAQQAADPKFRGDTPLGVAAPALSKTADPLVAWSTSPAEQIVQAVCLLAYLSSAQQPTIATPPRSVGHTDTALLEDYAADGFPVEVGP